MKKNPGYVVVHPMNNKVLRWVSATQRGMPTAFKRAVELAAHYAAKDKMEIPVVASITRIPTGHVVTDLFYFGGKYVLVDGALNVREAQGMPKAIMRRGNIARKQDVPWREPEVQARLTFPGFHSAWDEPEDHPPYPMAGAVRRKQEKEQQQIIAQRKAEMRELGRKPRMKLHEGFIEKAPWGREWKSNQSSYYSDGNGYGDEPEVYCPACGGEPAFLGTLGKYDWFRCRHCGLDFRLQTNPASLAQDVVAIYEAKGERGANRHRILVTQEYDGCYTIRLVSRGVNYKSYGGICDWGHLNNLLMNMVFDLQQKAGLDYNLVYP